MPNGVISTGNHPKSLWPGIKSHWGRTYDDYGMECKDLFDFESSDKAYEEMVAKLRPWTIDFHVAQNDGQVHGAGNHDKTGKHCPADDPNGKLDIVKCSKVWLQDAEERGIQHICWDGCMFPNATLENPETWNTILAKMVEVRDACGW